MIDVCPRCRIQAPHRPGRDRCPRCGGPLQVVDDAAQAQTLPPQPGPMPPGSGVRPLTPPSTAPTLMHQPPRPVPRGPAQRLYRSAHVRWVARRPPEAIPPPRRPARSELARRIPRYVYLPQWGLRDVPVGTEASAGRDTVTTLVMALRGLGGVLIASALIHLVRYLLPVVNRTTTLPQWLIDLTGALVVLCGTAGVLAFAAATVYFVRWIIDLRAEAYRGAGRLDPRRRRTVVLLAGVPLVNVVGAPLLLHEVAHVRTDVDPDQVAVRLKKLWVAWAVVNAAAVVALVARVAAWRSDSIQLGANALGLVVISTAVSAAFAFWLAARVSGLFAGRAERAVPDHRWVAVG